MSLDDSLPTDLASAHALIVAQRQALSAAELRATAAESEAQYRALLIEKLKFTIRKLQHDRFGQSSERGTLLDQLELQLADLEADAAQADTAGQMAAAAASEKMMVPSFERRRPARRPLPEHLPRERIVYPAPSACPCCGATTLRKIGEDVTETLELIPRQWKVIAHVREKFSCRACEAITQAPAPRLPSPWPVALWQWAQFSVQTASAAVMTLGVTSRAATSAAVKPRLIAVASSPNSPKTCSRFSGLHGSATARLSDGATGPTGLCALRA